MDNDSDQFAATKTNVEGLPISQTLMQRLEKVADSDGDVSADDAVAPIVAAIVSLERLIREVG